MTQASPSFDQRESDLACCRGVAHAEIQSRPRPRDRILAPAPNRTPALVCHSCGDTMNVDRKIPKLGVRPELLVFVCPSCKEILALKFKARSR